MHLMSVQPPEPQRHMRFNCQNLTFSRPCNWQEVCFVQVDGFAAAVLDRAHSSVFQVCFLRLTLRFRVFVNVSGDDHVTSGGR